MVETELCAFSVEACRTAARLGVTRVELCASPWEGGTTPSAATIWRAREIPNLQLCVMIRPRGGDFCYSDEEFETMLGDVRFARTCGADCIATGVLTPEGRIDTLRTAQLVEAAGPMQVTFHRAFDMTHDCGEALEALIQAGCRRVLTSAGHNTAIEGLDALRELVARAAGRIDIMAGSGVRTANALRIAATGVQALHFSARRMEPSRMCFRNPAISMGGLAGIPEYASVAADERQIAALIETLNQ